MRLLDSSRRFILLVVAGAFLITTTLQPVYATMVDTQTALKEARGDIDRAELLELLERDAVQEKLEAHGVNPADAKDRVAAMTDEEIAEMQTDMESLAAGGNTGLFLLLLLIPVAFYVYWIFYLERDWQERHGD